MIDMGDDAAQSLNEGDICNLGGAKILDAAAWKAASNEDRKTRNDLQRIALSGMKFFSDAYEFDFAACKALDAETLSDARAQKPHASLRHANAADLLALSDVIARIAGIVRHAAEKMRP